MIITFANQKGGAGKTTLCMLFANYLAKQGKAVIVYDVDPQISIYRQREKDMYAFPEADYPYTVDLFEIKAGQDKTKAFMNALKGFDDGFVLLDAPGNLSDESLLEILLSSDVIVCPYQYEPKCLESTAVFLRVLEHLEKNYLPSWKKFFVPNRYRARVGTQQEKIAYAQIDDTFRTFGDVTPSIKDTVILGSRINTIGSTDDQNKEVRASFDYIIKHLTDDLS